MLLFYLITLLHGSNSLPLSLLENVEMPLPANVERDINTTDVDTTTIMPDDININTTKTVLADTTTKDVTVLEEIKSNPEKFISEVQNLDPVALRHIITLLEDLREKSETRENELDTDLANKKKALSDADADVVTAGDVLDDANQAVADAEIIVGEKQDLVTDAENKVTEAQGAVTEAQAVVGEKQGVATAAESDLAAKKEVHKEKKAAKEASEKAHNDEVPDLNDEQEVLTHVIAILEELHGKQGSSSIGCADGSIEQVFQEGKMVGCDGNFVNSNFRNACADGWHVATAADYFAFGGKTVQPNSKRWVDVAWDSNGHETSLEGSVGKYYDRSNRAGWDGVSQHTGGCTWISTVERCWLTFVDKDYGESYGCHCRGGNPTNTNHGVMCASN